MCASELREKGALFESKSMESTNARARESGLSEVGVDGCSFQGKQYISGEMLTQYGSECPRCTQ